MKLLVLFGVIHDTADNSNASAHLFSSSQFCQTVH